MTKISQTQDDLIKHLNEQLGFLRRSASSYDAGFIDEAKRLAVTIRVLVHDTTKSTSLLQQLNEKKRMFYDSSMAEDPGNFISFGGLIQMELGPNGAIYMPFLDNIPPSWVPQHVSFADWWNRPIFRIQEGETLSRCNLVLWWGQAFDMWICNNSFPITSLFFQNFLPLRLHRKIQQSKA